MRRIISLLFIIAVAGMCISCDTGNTGNFKIRLRLPIDDGDCRWSDSDDNTYCINSTDQILLSIFSTSDPNEPYVYTDRRLFRVTSDRGGKEEFIRSLRSGNYYRFFVEVTNVNEKLKMTGGIDGVYYDDSENYEVNIFLGAVGDFVRVVKDRSRYNSTSLQSYFDDSNGSSGSGAVALKNGDLFMSGGYCHYFEEYKDNAMIFDMKDLSSKSVARMRAPVQDHVVALVDDGSETGKVVIAFGETGQGMYSNAISIYDPETNNHRDIDYKEGLTMAKGITIDGEVYIVGGCSTAQPGNKVYKVTRDLQVMEYATLNQGRCNHSIADVSTYDEEGNINVRILVVGGSTDAAGEEIITNNENFAEIISGNVSKPVNIVDRRGGDSTELLSRGLVSAAATNLSWDDSSYGPDIAVLAVGGFLQDGEGDNFRLMANPNLFIFTEKDSDTWTYDVNGSPFNCARPSIANIATIEKSIPQFAAVNCKAVESSQIRRGNAREQTIFVVQVRRSRDSELNLEILSASVRDSLMNENIDPENGVFVDGPATSNSLGQAFIFGTQYVYQISGLGLPF